MSGGIALFNIRAESTNLDAIAHFFADGTYVLSGWTEYGPWKSTYMEWRWDGTDLWLKPFQQEAWIEAPESAKRAYEVYVAKQVVS